MGYVFEGAWVYNAQQYSEWVGGNYVTRQKRGTLVWRDSFRADADFQIPQDKPPAGKEYTGPAKYSPTATTIVETSKLNPDTGKPVITVLTQPASVAAFKKGQGIVAVADVGKPHRYLERSEQYSVWEGGNYVSKMRVRKDDLGAIQTEISKFPAPPSDYPFKAAPQTPLDSQLPTPQGKKRYGGLDWGKWQWIKWRRLYLWGIPSQSIDMIGVVEMQASKLMSAKEQAFINADSDYTKAKTSFEDVAGIAIMTGVGAITAAGVVSAIGAAGAAGAGAGSAGASGAGVVGTGATVSTTAPSLSTMAGYGSMVGGWGAGIGGSAAVVPSSLVGIVGAGTAIGVGTATAAGGIGAGTLGTIGTAAAGAGLKIAAPLLMKELGLTGQQPGATTTTPAEIPVVPTGIPGQQPGLLDQLGLGGVNPILLGGVALVALVVLAG